MKPWAVVDERRLFPAPLLDVKVEGVVARVEAAPFEPSVRHGYGPRLRLPPHAVPSTDPADVLGRLGPEGLRVAKRSLVHSLVRSTHWER
jgi:hypothetical protein